jgi:hypothetical protein
MATPGDLRGSEPTVSPKGKRAALGMASEK